MFAVSLAAGHKALEHARTSLCPKASQLVALRLMQNVGLFPEGWHVFHLLKHLQQDWTSSNSGVVDWVKQSQLEVRGYRIHIIQ